MRSRRPNSISASVLNQSHRIGSSTVRSLRRLTSPAYSPTSPAYYPSSPAYCGGPGVPTPIKRQIGSLTVRSLSQAYLAGVLCGPGVLDSIKRLGSGPSPFFSRAYVTRAQCRPGVWNQPTTRADSRHCVPRRSYLAGALRAPARRPDSTAARVGSSPFFSRGALHHRLTRAPRRRESIEHLGSGP